VNAKVRMYRIIEKLKKSLSKLKLWYGTKIQYWPT
jgi:hypothetical protein